MSKKIECEVCSGTGSDPNTEFGGCIGCGGYGWTHFVFICPSCSRSANVRNLIGVTVYDGKVIRCGEPLDELVWERTGMICKRCYDKGSNNEH